MVEDRAGPIMNRRGKLISTYTPSNTDPALLSQILVQRKRLLEQLVIRLTRSMTSGDKHHLLLVGPRGSGKTNLVTLALWQLRENASLRDSMRIAWLGEDDIFSSLTHLAFGIAEALAKEYPDEFPSDFKSPLRRLKGDDVAMALLNSIIERLGHRHLLLATENLDQTFSALGTTGQRKWRAFLQETRRFATLATTQKLFAAVSSRDESFFGFFEPFHLEPLSVEDAQRLIHNIAKQQENHQLVDYLGSDQGRFRVRALHHLAGGNHRMYVLLSEFLTRDSLDDLIEAFEALADDLTPYFQERMRSLPDQQRQLLQCLCDAQGALTVKQIAEETFIPETTCSKQLGTLKNHSYVCSEKRGKESFYDMAEPLMRLCLDVKNQRGKPLRLVARFLKVWFPQESLKKSSQIMDGRTRTADYCEMAMQENTGSESSFKDALLREIRSAANDLDFLRMVSLANEFSAMNPRSANDVLATLGQSYKRSADSAKTPTENLISPAAPPIHHDSLVENTSENESTAIPALPATICLLLIKSARCAIERDYDKAIACYSILVEMPDASAEQKATAFTIRGSLKWRIGQWRESAEDFVAAIELPGVTSIQRVKPLFFLPDALVAFAALGEVTSALRQAFEKGDRKSNYYGGTPDDFLATLLRRAPGEWREFIASIAPLYDDFKVADKLGAGIMASIRSLDNSGFSPAQLDEWNDAWQIAGTDIEALKIPLECLDAAVEVLKSDPPTDRPLFRLPPEIRELVRPLLQKKLGTE
jgi:DNA polymerase III delta prime subunit